jgi:hypothetical protein
MGAILAFPTGGLVGYLLGSRQSEHELFNLALADGRAMLAEVEVAAPTLREVATELEQIAQDEPASGADVQGLLGVRQPIDADLFRQRRYKAFQPDTVDNLLRYYTAILMIWDGLRGLGQLKSALESHDDDERALARARLSEAARRLLGLTRQAMQLEAMLRPRLSAIAKLPER